ncbi:MAG TPA: HEAT repeat domain-containing protein [Nitrospirae bacterium]|nr:HEAT repeat domain-containing protein [Nitrospirota bacterium]HDK16936.1 HEAT repeat domain-containing protein [Nitrospirota bacterium]HDK80984.1 HEAT repeat domain-containing protein [Nitrospirota bacterium]HDO25208.1 HEAT repeat domain-containing protein [Nitrospirota bacterium]
MIYLSDRPLNTVKITTRLLFFFLFLLFTGCSRSGDLNSSIEKMKDENPSIRWQASLALAEIGEPAVEPLISAIKDNDPGVRESAVQALGQIKDPGAVKPLMAALKDSNPYVQEEAALALQEITGGSYAKFLPGKDTAR